MQKVKHSFLTKQMELLQLENGIRQEEIDENEAYIFESSSCTLNKNLYHTITILPTKHETAVSELVKNVNNEIPDIPPTITNPEKEDRPYNIQVLCKTMNETIRAVTSKPNQSLGTGAGTLLKKTVKLKKCLRGEQEMQLQV